jgi:hypothetical protein
MSYENPRAIIDTQSAQGLQQLQNTIAGTFAGVAKNYKADQKEKRDKLNANAKRIDGIKARNQEYEDNIRNRMNEFGAENPSLNNEAWLGAIDRINEIKNTIDLGNEKPEVVARLRQELSTISALPTLGRTLLTDMSEGVIGLSGLIENTGKEGGLDRYGNPDIVEDLKTWENTAKGSRKQVVEADGNGGWRVSLDINGRRYTKEQLANVKNNDSGMVSIVPDQSDNFAVYSDLVRDIDPKTKKPKFKEGVLGDIDSEIRTDKNGNKFLVKFRKVNVEEAKGLAKIQIDAGIAGMSLSERAVYWNNILAKKTANNELEGDVMTAESFKDEEMVTKFNKAYTDKWFKANIGEEVIIDSEKIKVDKPNQSEITLERNRKKYEDGVAVIDAYEDDLSFNRYSTNDSFNDIKEFAGQASIGLADAIKPQTAEDDDAKIIGFTVKFLDGKGSAAVKPGMSDKQIRKILKRAMIGGQSFYKEKPIKKSKGDSIFK